MSEDLSGAPEELEPEARRPGSAPAKKPLAEFLADFEARLRDHPDEPATGAMQVVEDRAAGARRGPAQVAPAPPSTSAMVSKGPLPTEIESTIEPSLEVPVEDAQATIPPDPEGAQPPATEGGSADASGESRRLRGRRRRKHRHRAH